MTSYDLPCIVDFTESKLLCSLLDTQVELGKKYFQDQLEMITKMVSD